MSDETLVIVIPLALFLGIAVPLVMLWYFKKKGWDVWDSQKPLSLTPQQHYFLVCVSRARYVAFFVLIFVFGALYFMEESSQIRSIGASLLLFGFLIMLSGCTPIITHETRIGGRGVGSHRVRGISAIITGVLTIVLGVLIAIFGFGAAFLPFGFFS